jgi:hypothetical protein
MTEIDMPELTARILTLARDPDLRARMGAAGLARARSHYDWSRIIPQMQDLWAEQDLIRRTLAHQSRRYGAHALPIAPSPGSLFGGYPTETARFGDQQFAANSGMPSVADILSARNYLGTGRMFAEPAQITSVLSVLNTAGPATLAQVLAGMPAAGFPALSSTEGERILIWLLKYGLARRV